MELYKTATGYTLPPLPVLDIHDSQAVDKFNMAWMNYSLVTELNKTEAVQVATLLTVIGKEACDVFLT